MGRNERGTGREDLRESAITIEVETKADFFLSFFIDFGTRPGVTNGVGEQHFGFRLIQELPLNVVQSVRYRRVSGVERRNTGPTVDVRKIKTLI